MPTPELGSQTKGSVPAGVWEKLLAAAEQDQQAARIAAIRDQMRQKGITPKDAMRLSAEGAKRRRLGSERREVVKDEPVQLSLTERLRKFSDKHPDIGVAATVCLGIAAVCVGMTAAAEYHERPGPKPTDQEQAELNEIYRNTDPQEGPVVDSDGDGKVHGYQKESYLQCVTNDGKGGWKAASGNDINQVLAFVKIDPDHVIPNVEEDRVVSTREDPRCTPDTE